MNEILTIIAEFQSLQLDKVIDFAKFNQYAIVHHSSAIEGSTLTENETRLLLDEGVTPKGKPLTHSLMIKDHFEALLFTLDEAGKKPPVTVSLIQRINEKVMKNTGAIYNTPLGQVDASKGEFRKGNVSAGGSYFVNFDKVGPLTAKLVQKLNSNISNAKSVTEKLEISFAAHFDLVTIHPFYDGNGRTSRLLMNFIQHYFDLPFAIVYKEDKADYFTALQQTRKQENISIFYGFMYEQYKKFLLTEIAAYKSSADPKGKGFSLFFSF